MADIVERLNDSLSAGYDSLSAGYSELRKEAAEEIMRLRAKTAPSAPDGVMAALDNLDDYIARIEGNDRGACDHINLLRRYLLDATEVGENE